MMGEVKKKMPQIKGGPKSLNVLLERVYADCMSEHNNESRCSAAAWTAARNDGWEKGKDGKWHKKIKKTTGTNFGDLELAFNQKQGTITQSILLSKNRFKAKKEALLWLKKHSKKFGDIDETEQNFRARQRESKDFKPKTFRTHRIDDGVTLVIGKLKEGKI